MAHFADTVDLAVESTADAFLRNPANYSDERALTEAIRTRVNTTLPPVTVEDVLVEESTAARGATTDHEAYTANYRETTRIDAAQCEVGGPQFPFGDQERLDLGVFRDGVRLRVVDGTQQFDPTALAGAVACKYVKNTNYLRYRPDDEESTYHDVASDIRRLGELSDSTGRWCVVVGNYDLFRGDDGTGAKRHLQRLAKKCGVALRFVFPDPHPDFG